MAIGDYSTHVATAVSGTDSPKDLLVPTGTDEYMVIQGPTFNQLVSGLAITNGSNTLNLWQNSTVVGLIIDASNKLQVWISSGTLTAGVSVIQVK